MFRERARSVLIVGQKVDEAAGLREQLADLGVTTYRQIARFTDEDIEESFDQISKTAARMEDALAGGPWLLGDIYTLADVIVAPLIDRAYEFAQAAGMD